MSENQELVVLEEIHVVCREKDKLEKSFFCDFCGKRFSTKNELSVHLHIHTGEKPFECEQCHKKFCQKDQLQNHYKKHITINADQNQVDPLPNLALTRKIINVSKLNNSEFEYPCDICEKRFANRALLSVHLRMHTKERPFECEICLKKFSQVGNLKTHYLIHTNKKPFQCNVCRKRFVQKGNLQTHYKTHTKEKPFQCRTCNKKFTQKGNLVSHEKSYHFKQKPYECNVCQKTFATQFYFQKHSQVHISDTNKKGSGMETRSSITNLSVNHNQLSVTKPYECAVCQKSFDKKQNLNLHYRVHTNIVASKLNQISCQQSTNMVENTSVKSNNTSIDSSVPSGPRIESVQVNAVETSTAQGNNESHSLDTLENPERLESDDSMSDTIDYLIDTDDNSLICGKCNKTFSGKPSFLIHYRIHAGMQLFECSVCNKKFNQRQTLEYHERIHIGDRPYKCELCPKSFTQKQNLLVHLRVHTGERPYQCEQCPKWFYQKNALVLHGRNAHGKGKLNTRMERIQKRLLGSSVASYNQFKQKLVLRRQQDTQIWEIYNVSENS